MRTARRLAEQLRRRRETLGLTLQEVSRQSAEYDDPVPVSTLSRIERGELDPGVRRLHVLLRIYRIDPVLAADFAELERRTDESPTGDLATLKEGAKRHWDAGNVSQTLSHIFAILLLTDQNAGTVTERQKALQFSAIVARSLGKLRLAKRIVDDLLCQRLERSQLVDVLVLGAALWSASGSSEVAIALLRRAAERVDSSDLRRVALIKHQEAKLEAELGQPERAEALLTEALEGYRTMGDTLNEARARLLGIAVKEKLAPLDAAIAWAREAVAFAEAKDHGLVKTRAHLELGRVLLAAGRSDDAAEELRRALASAVLLQDPNAEYHAHALLAQTFEAVGDPARAEAESDRAAALWRWAQEERGEDPELR